MNNKPLKIYLGDLTYDTVTVSTNSFPLNIGYIASYCIGLFKSKVEIKLFKYIKDLELAILTSPPDLLGLSNYCWNQNVSHEMFTLLHNKNPNALSVWGGPNIPGIKSHQEEWLKNFPEVDVYVPLEGEIGFSNVVENVLQEKNRGEIRKNMRKKSIDACIIRGPDDTFHFAAPSKRPRELDEIPSPYLTGLMDKFFDGRLDPFIQASRGCPFKCTYCVDGSDLVTKVTRFCQERLSKELEYIAKRVPKNIHTLGISDLNFGSYRGDLELCNLIADIQKKYKYPRLIFVQTGKNSKDNIIKIIKRLGDSIKLTMSVQSMDKSVLKNIKRENISEEKMLALKPTIEESGLQTKTEAILGLPGDSYEGHLYTLKTLLKAEIDEILVFTCMLLPGSELYSMEERKKWNLKSKHRILPRDFAKLNNGKIVIETEEVVVGTDQLTFEQYVELRLFNFILRLTSADLAYPTLKKFLKEHNIEFFDLINKMFKNLSKAPECIKKVCNEYKDSTVNELFDSREEIISHYQQETEYKKLLEGEAGINVMYHYQTMVMVNYMSEWTKYIFTSLKELLSEQSKFDEVLSKQFHDVANYSLGISFNPLGRNRMSTNPKYKFYYDINKWLHNKNKKEPLTNFKSPSKIEIEFRHTKDQYNVIQDQLNRFDDNIVSISTALFATTQIPSHYLWRKPIVVD
jgi:radical SAM superfamily enzyme YgiQ (UPF0313 family)